jgi:RHS repeat-associated protein
VTSEYVFFGGKRIARRDASNNIYYYAEDFIGSSRVMTTSNGTVCYEADFYPYGGERTITNTCPQNYKFQGKERDSETGNDDFGARYYSSSFGRWLSPDWSSIPAPVPYADLSNPQTLNLYQFVKNDPETFTDPDGHNQCGPTCPASLFDNVGTGGKLGDISPIVPNPPKPPTASGAHNQILVAQAAAALNQAQVQQSTSATANGTTVTITTETTTGPDGAGTRTIENRTGTHAFRDNNPGNIRAGNFATANGAIGTDNGFAIFPNSGTGFQAMSNLLSGPSYQKLTVDQAISRYAPPSENNTAAYQAAIRTAVGVSGNTPMSALNGGQRGQMAQAIARHEGFYVQGTVEKVVIPIFPAP